MKYIKLFEAFTKDYMKKIDLKDFKKIKKGAKIKYMGGSAVVIDNNGYVLTLKREDGKTVTVNKSQFDHGGMISEISVTNEGLKAKTPNEVITIDLDMGWDDSNPEEDKAAKAAFKKYKIKVEPASHSDQEGTFEVTGKKKDILAYLQSEFYEMDADAIEEYYPELLEGTLDEEVLKSFGIKYRDLGKLAKAAIDESVVKESFIGPFVFNDTMSDEELKTMYNGALDGYANWQKGFQYPKAKYKQAYQEIEKLLKKRGVSVDESAVIESSAKDGGDKSNGNSHHEDHTDNSIAQHWKDTYGEEFHSKYPAVAKIVKQRNIKDKRELKRIWDETYGENFEEQYPALYNKLD